MKNLRALLACSIICISIFAQSCNSGKNAPADSHPDNGSVKPGVNSDLDKQSDTAKKDSIAR